MKITIIILICCLLMVWFLACGEDPNLPQPTVDADNDDIVELSAIERALSKMLGKPSTEITKEDLTTVTHLTVLYWDTHYGGLLPLKLTELEDCINLTTLNLFGNTISDLSPLVGLTKLTNLNLFSNSITDITPLKGLVNLQQLSLNSNRITDLRPLASLINLQHLDLQDNRISDITSLKGLNQLEKLYLNDNQIVDLKPLVDNPGLVNENPVHLEGDFDFRADVVAVGGNPLSEVSRDEHIPALEARGVIVHH